MAIRDASDTWHAALDEWITTPPAMASVGEDDEAREQRWRQHEGDIRDFITAEGGGAVGVAAALRAFANAVNPRLWRG